MKVQLILLAVIGTSLALTPGIQYKYSYEGRLGVGIPEIRNKFSGLGIKATVTLQMQTQNVAVFKFDDIQVGEYVGEAGVQVTNPLPIKYSPLRGHGKVLAEPFKVFFNKDQDGVMVVPQADQEFVVNLRKSVVQLFLIEPIRGNYNFEDFTQNAFTTTEPTIFGSCSVDYVITPIDPSTIPQKNVINPISASVSDADNTYILKRTVNFDSCDELVRLMYSSVGNFDGVSNNLYHNVASRSSMVTATIAGKGGDYYVIEQNVQGYYSVNPFGVPTDKLTYLTNQDLVFESASPISSKMDVAKPYRVVNNFYMEVASPYAQPEHPVPFINYYNKKDATYSPILPVNVVTGIPLTQNYISKLTAKFDSLIHESATLMLTVGPAPTGYITPLRTDEGKFTTMLDAAVEVSLGVDVQHLEQLFEKYYNDKTELGEMKLKLFIDVCAASGATAPLKVVITEIQNGRITPERTASIFVTLSNNFVAAPLIPDFLKYVKTVDVKTNPIVATNVLINFATIVRRVCYQTSTVSTVVYGRQECDTSFITGDFIPYLQQKFTNAQESYERVVYVEALSNLGTPEVFNFIAEIVTGDYDVTVREVAVLALKYSNVRNYVDIKTSDNIIKASTIPGKDDVFNILMPIVHNVNEDPILRQYAIAVLVSWRPSPSWWYRLAISTRTEPSTSVGSFIYYLIKYNYYNAKDTQESKIAQFVLPLTKSFPPVSSYSLTYDQEYSDDYSNILLNSVVLNDDKSTVPRVLYTLMRMNVGGVQFPFVEAAFITSTTGSAPTLYDSFSEFTSNKLQQILRTAPNRRAEEIVQEIKKHVKSFLKPKTSQQEESILGVKLFDNLQFMVPFSYNVNSILNSGTWKFLQSMLEGRSLQLSKFMNPAPFRMFLPTELGLPFIATISTPTVQSAEGKVKVAFGNKGTTSILDFLSFKSFDVDLTTNYKYTSKVATEFQVVVPWNEKVVAAGVETLKTVTLPIHLQVSFENHDNIKNVSFALIPTYQKEHVAAYVSNIPYVARRSMYPGQIMSEYESYEIVTEGGTEHGLNQERVVIDKELTGLDASVVYEGDIPFPFSVGTFFDNFNNPYKLISKIVSPSSKLFASAFVVNYGSSETEAVYPSVTFTSPFYTEHVNNVDDEETNEFAFRILTTGTESRYYESYFQSKVVSRDSYVKKTDIIYRDVQQLPKTKPQVFCFQVESIQPVSYDFQTLLKVVSSNNFYYTFNGKVNGGTTCSQAQFATLKGVFRVSEDKKKTIVDEITNELKINKDSEATFENTPFYDQTSILVQYKQSVPDFFTNMTYNFYDTLHGSQFPYVSSNYYNVQNPKGKITIDGKRNVDGTWNLKTELPTENVQMENFDLPLVFKVQLYLYGQNVFFY